MLAGNQEVETATNGSKQGANATATALRHLLEGKYTLYSQDTEDLVAG
jgi:hypothetical protein